MVRGEDCINAHYMQCFGYLENRNCNFHSSFHSENDLEGPFLEYVYVGRF